MAQNQVDQMFATVAETPVPQNGATAIPALAQNDIDQLFGTAPPKTAPAGGTAADPELNDIDQLFGPASGPPDELAGKPDLAQNDVDRMFG
jgi:hypothetical protein